MPFISVSHLFRLCLQLLLKYQEWPGGNKKRMKIMNIEHLLSWSLNLRCTVVAVNETGKKFYHKNLPQAAVSISAGCCVHYWPYFNATDAFLVHHLFRCSGSWGQFAICTDTNKEVWLAQKVNPGFLTKLLLLRWLRVVIDWNSSNSFKQSARVNSLCVFLSVAPRYDQGRSYRMCWEELPLTPCQCGAFVVLKSGCLE